MSVEFVGIELDLRGEEGVLSSLKQIDTLINSLGGKKKVDIGLRQIERDLISARAQLHAYQKDQEGLTKGSTAWRIMQGYIEETKEEIFELTTAAKVARASIKSMGDTFKQTFNKTSSMVTHLGSKMQSFGNALTRFTSPFNRIMTGALYGVGYKALNTLTEGFSQSFARADTMNKYTKLMEEYETETYSAAQSRKDLDESVQGLPIALNDAIAMAQRYTLSLGDMEKGTKLAIATNNAFLASMATETQRYQGMLQLQDLMNGKDLQPREWMSLGSSMGKAINEIGLKLGYGKDQLGEFRQQLYAGKIDTQEFLDALIEVGTGEGSLVGLAKLSAETWEGLFSNIKIATTRMGADIIETLNDTIQKSTGRTLLQQLLGIDAEGKRTYDGVRDWINNMSKSVQNWVKANPDKILNFFNQIKSIKWGSILKGVAQGFSEILKIIGAFSKLASGAGGGKDLSWIGKWMIRLSLLGRFMTIFGGMTKGSSGPVATIVATIKTLRRAAGAGSLMDALKELIGIGGKGSDLGEMGEKMSKTGGSMGKFSLGLSKWFKGWAQVAAAVGGTAFVGFVSFKAVKSMLNDLREMVDIASDIDWAKGASVLAGMTGFFTGFIALGELVGSKLSLGALKLAGTIAGVATIFSVTFWADMKLIKGGFKSIADATKYMQTAMDNLKSIKPLEGSVITKVRQVIGVFNQITELLAIERNTPSGEGERGLKELDKKSAKTVENLANSLKNIVSGIKSLNAINDVKLNTENLETNMTSLGDAVEAISTVLDEMPTTMKGEQAQTWSKNIEKATASFRNAFKNLTGTDGILTNLRNITAELRNIDMVSVETQFSRLGQALDTISGSLEGTGADMTFASRMDNFRAAIKSMKFTLAHLNQIATMKVDTSGAARKITEAINSLSNVFSSATVDTLKADIKALVDSIKSAMDQFAELNTEIKVDASVKLSSGFEKSVQNVIKTIENAKSRIKKVASKPIKIRIPVAVTFSVTTNLGSALSVIWSAVARIKSAVSGGGGSGSATPSASQKHGGAVEFSTGGLVYRASGGSIPHPGRPRGTDNIPAWLTGGEYVQNKRAVNLFGIDFMRKVNNLDIRGAMDELMYKAGNMASLNSRSTTINNYYNNNQKVVQNISTNSPDFAFRTASRFVGAF